MSFLPIYSDDQIRLGFFSGKLDFDFPAIDNGKSTSIIVYVPGVSPGSGTIAVAGFSSILPSGCSLSAQVVAPDRVAVVLMNSSGAPINLGVGTISAMVFVDYTQA